MVTPDGLAALAVDGGQRVLADLELAVDPGLVHDEARYGVHGVVDVGDARLGDDGAGVADLATALGIEGRAVQEDLDRAGVVALHALEHGQHPGGRLVVLQAAPDEGGLAFAVEQGAVGRFVAGPGRLRRGPGALALLAHGGVEAGPIDFDPGVASQLLGQLDREAVGVVQGEGHVARQHLRPGGEGLLQPTEAGAQRAVEARLLARHRVHDQVVLGDQRGPGLAEHLGGRLHQGGTDGLVHAQAAGGHHGATDDAAQDVAAALRWPAGRRRRRAWSWPARGRPARATTRRCVRRFRIRCR